MKTREFLASPRILVPDAPTRGHLAIAAVVLAAYHELRAAVPDIETRVDLLKHALLDAYRAPFRWPFRFVLRLSPDRFRTLTRLAAAGWVERRLFGAGFRFQRRDGGNSFDLLIDRCLYHRFFCAHGAPELTPVICHSDHAWIDEVDPATHGVRFTRPTTLGWGDAACVFRFDREPDQAAKSD